MLALEKISIQFADRSLFSDVSFTVGPKDRIGLVGSNGAGKTTLLKIVAGLQQADTGSVMQAHYVSVGYLPQDGVIASGRTLLAEAETAFEDILKVQHDLEEARELLSRLDPRSGEHADILEVYGELAHKLEDLDAFRMRSKVERVLMGLGFSVQDFHRQTEEFSGGWQMRIALAKLLLREPSLLLLDEPTNHLDIESLQWLEEYLRAYNGAVILVSHDRAFLDTLTTKTLSIGLGRISIYAGNYTFFEKEKALRHKQQEKTLKNQERQIEQSQRFIDRFRYKATKARQVQSRIKQLEKIQLVEVEGAEEEIRFQFPEPVQSGSVVMRLVNVSKWYGELCVFRSLNFTVERGDRIAILGVNGAGKSTLARLLAGVEVPSGGDRLPGHNVLLSYFAQHQAEELDPAKEVLQIVEEVASGETRLKLRTLLGAFLFHGDDVVKRVGVLSGGEKSRLALAKMLLRPSNLLVMDEPTNHLDMRSKNVLMSALREYQGTLVIVSHDRAFLEPLITKVVEVSPQGVRTFPGRISEYLARKHQERRDASPELPTGGTRAGPPADKTRKRLEAEGRQRLYRALKPHRQKLEEAEREIARLESRKSEIETLLADPTLYKQGEEARKIAHEYKKIHAELQQAYKNWGQITETIETIEERHLPHAGPHDMGRL